MAQQGDPPAHTAVAVDKLVESMAKKLEEARAEELCRESPPTIHRVRPSVRAEDPRAYDSKILSLGPFPGRKGGMVQMEKLKLKFMNDLIDRSSGNSVKKYFDVVRKWERKVKAEYSGEIELDSDEFVEKMVLDGCFLVECLVKGALGQLGTALALANCNTTLLRNDCLLFENQIPFFLVSALYGESEIGWAVKEGTSPPTAWRLAAHLLKINNLPVPPAEEALSVYHLLHLYHSSLNPALSPDLPPKSCRQAVTRHLCKLINFVSLIFYGVLYFVLMCKWPRRSPSGSTTGNNKTKFPRMIPCAKELQEAGITIKKRRFANPSQSCFLKVSFEDGTLQIPFLSVEESTNSKFRNLVAFEQCCPRVGNYFTSYAIFMDNIVNTAADVAVLRSSGVIESKLGSDEEVAHMFNSVCKGAHLNYEDHYLAMVFREIKGYCDSSRHRWRAKLVHDYFGSPWSVISLIVASVLLIFTGMQTVYAVVAYYHPPKQS